VNTRVRRPVLYGAPALSAASVAHHHVRTCPADAIAGDLSRQVAMPGPEIPPALRTRAGAVAMGLALGALSPAQLRARTARYYSGGVAGHIDYADLRHNRSGLTTWEHDAVATWFPPAPARILVYGAGGGREVLALAGLGYDVCGVECHPGLVRAGNELLAAERVPGRIAHLPEDEPPAGVVASFDAAVIGWSAYAHVQSRRARVRLLRGIGDVCAADAPLLLSFFVRTREQFRFDIAAAVGTRVRRLRGLEPVEEGDILGHTWIHMFSRRSIRDELWDAGWEMLHYATGDVAHAVARRRG
jgi:hypothetical protein